MNEAEDARNKRIGRMTDDALLRYLLSEGTVPRPLFDIFTDMMRQLDSGGVLSVKQRALAEAECRKVMPVSAANAPRGREVPTPAVLQNLPKRPPGRRA